MIYTRAHPDPKPPKVVDNPQKLIRKRSLTESQESNNPLPRVNSLLESFSTVEDIEFDLPFEHSLFHTKVDTFVPNIVFDESILKPYISKGKIV